MKSLSQEESDKIKTFIERLSYLIQEFSTESELDINFMGLLEIISKDNGENIFNYFNVLYPEPDIKRDITSPLRILENTKLFLIQNARRSQFIEDLRKKIEEGLWVVCINDENKPTTYDECEYEWLKKGKVYKVESFFFDILQDGNLGFKLKDVVNPPHFGGFSITRFLIYDNKVGLN